MIARKLSSNRGSVSTLAIAGISVLALAAGLVGLALTNQTVTQNTQAATMSSGVRLMTIDSNDSGCTKRVSKTGDKSINVCGRVCFSQNYRSGGRDTGTLFLTDDQNNRVHEGNSSFTFDVASLDFPAPCDYVNRDTGEAELKNGQATKSNLFNIPVTFDRPLTDSFCPDLYVNYRARVVSGQPFAKISLRDAGLCQPAASPTPTPSTRPNTPPAQQPPAQSQSPIPGDKITGTISVYSCQKPEYVGLVTCEEESCSDEKSVTLPFNQSDPTAEVEDGVWLDDNNTDNTWIYRYNFSKFKGQPLYGNAEYIVGQAVAKIDSSAQPKSSFYYSSREVGQILKLKPGSKQDFSVDASKTCGCPFNATAYVRSGATGELITDLDTNLSVNGTANNKQIIDRGDAPVQSSPFKGGQLKVNVQNFVTNTAGSYGEDALANIKLYAPGYKVTKQKCVSTGSADACPTYTKSYEKNGEELANGHIFENVRVACGVNVEYGWYVLSPTPTPSPTPAVGDLEIHMVYYSQQQDPPSCTPEFIESQNIQGEPVGATYAHFDWMNAEDVPMTIVGPETRTKADGQGGAHRRYNGLKAGEYKIEFSMDENRMKYMRLAKNCPTTVTVGAGTTKAKLVFYVRKDDKFEIGDSVGNSCTMCQRHEGATCGPAIAGKVLCLNPGEYHSPEPENPPGENPGVCAQWCATESHCRSQGWEPRDPPAGEHCSNSTGPNEKWCCRPGTTLPTGSPDPGNPPAPGDPGIPPPDPGGQTTGDLCLNDKTDGFYYLTPGCPADPNVNAAGCSANKCVYGGYSANDGGDYYCCNVQTPASDTCSSSSGGTCRASCLSGEGEISGPGLCSGSTPRCCKRTVTPPPARTPVTPSPVERRWYFIEFDLEGRSQNQDSVIPQFCEPGRRNCIDLEEISIREKPILRDYSGTVEKMLPTNKTYVATCIFKSFNRINSTTRRNCIEKPVSPGGRPKFTLTHNETGSFEGDFQDSGFASESIGQDQLDLDNNGVINTIDMLLIINSYGTSTSDTPEGDAEITQLANSRSVDINQDGSVNALDLSYVINSFGIEIRSAPKPAGK